MKKSIIILLTLVFGLLSSVSAQEVDLSLFKEMKARSIGPGGMSGRITAIDVVLKQDRVWYVGTASGGLWKTENAGSSFKPIFDDEKVQSIGSLAIYQNNPSIVWAGTGEGNPRNSNDGGFGIYKSLNGGETWELMGLEQTRHIYRVITHPDNPDVVWAAAIGAPWGESEHRGVYKTVDGGKNWTKVLYVNPKVGAADLVIDPANPNKLYAAMWEHKREPWFFNSGGPGSGLYVSEDGGENWVKRTSEDGLPKGDLGRIGLAVAPSNPDIVYATIESKKNAFYRSDDGGKSWKMQTNKGQFGDRPFYYAEIYVDTKNENKIYSLFSQVASSIDGGKNWDIFLPYFGVHPDHHAWWIHPEDPNFILDGTDGGLHVTYNGGGSWDFFDNIPVGQFYHVSVDNETPYNVYGGMQDNGSWRGPGYKWQQSPIRNWDWLEIGGGDGFDVLPDADDPRYVYAMSQQGNVGLLDTETGSSMFVKPTHPDSEMMLRFNWNAPIAQDPFDNSTIYFGSQFVHKSTNKGQTWEVISPDLTTNDPTKQDQSNSGGLTIDATGAENHTTLLSIEPSAVKQGVIWATSDDGKVHVTQDGGANWADVSKNLEKKGMPQGAWIPQVKASAKNAGEAFVVVNDYRRMNYNAMAFHTTDFGKTWKRIVDADDSFGFSLSILQDPIEPNLMFLGTENGLFVSFNGAKTWQHWTHDFPAGVPVADMVIHPREHDLVLGTYGRSIWVLDDIRPLRAAAANASMLTHAVEVFPIPDAYQLEGLKNPDGFRWSTWHLYEGENRGSNARISALINKKEGNKVNGDSVYVHIKDTAGEVIRTYRMKAPKESGVQRMGWDLREKGGRYIGAPKPRPTQSDRGGMDVMPGNYTVEIHYAGEVSSQVVKVHADPRFPDMNWDIKKKQHEMGLVVMDLMNTAAEATDTITEAEKVIKGVMTLAKDSNHSMADSLMKQSKAMNKKLTDVKEQFLGEQNDGRQGIVRSPNPNIRTHLSTASRYISRWNMPGEYEQSLIDNASNELNKGLDTLNAFVFGEWTAYKKLVTENPLTPFDQISEEEDGE